MPELIMLCGIPCSGKSTWILVGQTEGPDFPDDVVILSTDNYIQKEAEKKNATYNQIFDDIIKDATKELELELRWATIKDKNIIWDQTNLTPKARRKKLNKIPSRYQKIAMWFDIELEEALKRNQKRPGKVIPETVLRQMHSQFIPPTIDEGFDYVIKATP